MILYDWSYLVANDKQFSVGVSVPFEDDEVPDNWRICNGTPVDDPASPLEGRRYWGRGKVVKVRDRQSPLILLAQMAE